MHVEKQNLLFKYFSDTLAAIIAQAKRSGRYDQVSNTIFGALFSCWEGGGTLNPFPSNLKKDVF